MSTLFSGFRVACYFPVFITLLPVHYQYYRGMHVVHVCSYGSLYIHYTVTYCGVTFYTISELPF